MLRTLNPLKLLLATLCLATMCCNLTACDTAFNYSGTSQEDSSEDIVISNTTGINNQGVLTVTGDVTNSSQQNVNKLVVTVTFYDASGNELSKGKDTYEDILLPDETYHFKVNCIKKDAQSYDVNVNAYAY